MALPWYDIAGAWLAIFLTMCIFSFLYGDNPAYKFAEHLFVGVSIGIVVSEQWFGMLRPNLIDKLLEPSGPRAWLYVIPLVLVLFLFTKLTRKHSYLARIPIALMVSAFAAVKMTGEANGNLMVQVADSMPDLAAVYRTTYPHWIWNWDMDGAGVLSSLLVIIGLICCLVYFYFSVPHTGPLRYASRFGIWVLMVSFGASFGYTVMGRISLAYGRVLTLVGMDRTPDEAAQIHAPAASLISTVIIIVIIAAWRMRAPPEATVIDDG